MLGPCAALLFLIFSGNMIIKSKVEPSVIFPHPVLLLHGSEFPGITSAASVWWGELAEGAGLCPHLSPLGLSLALGAADPSPFLFWETWSGIILNYLAMSSGVGLNEYLQSTLRPLNERSYKNARCYYLFMKVLWVLANSMNCWHLIIETVCLSDPLW